MNVYVRMLLALSLITVVSGGALGGLDSLTSELAANNVLKFKKIPAVLDIHETASGKLGAEARAALGEALLAKKRLVDIGEKEPLLVFVLEKDGAPHAVTIEQYGKGYGGKLGVMAGFGLERGDLVGVGITTMAETPGIGTRVKEQAFMRQFTGMKPGAVLKVKKDGGDIDAITGATMSSRAVADALRLARETYDTHAAALRAAAGRESP